MALGNEQLCLLVFNIFAILCVVYSCIAIFNISNSYNELSPAVQEICNPYVWWKEGFLLHVIFFFMALSFTIGTCDTILNEEDRVTLEANSEPERQKFTSCVKYATEVTKVQATIFCGPILLIECLLSGVYFQAITTHC